MRDIRTPSSLFCFSRAVSVSALYPGTLVSEHGDRVEASRPAGGSGGCKGGNGDQQEGGAGKRERIERADLEQHSTHKACCSGGPGQTNRRAESGERERFT